MLKKTVGRNISEVLENPFLELVYHLEIPGNPWAAYYFTDNRPKNSACGVLVERRSGRIIHRLNKAVSGSTKRKPIFMPYSFVFNLEEEIHHYFFQHACGDIDLVNALEKRDKVMIKTLDPFFYTLLDLYQRAAYLQWPTEKFEQWPTFRTLTSTISTTIMVNGIRRWVQVTRSLEMRYVNKSVEFVVNFGFPSWRSGTFAATINRQYNLKELPTVKQFVDDPRHQPIYELVFRDYDERVPPKKR